MANRTVFRSYNDTKEKLKNSGVKDFGFEARVIIKHITGFDNKKVILNYNAVLSDKQEKQLEAIISRRISGYPLQYIIGKWGFYGLEFNVGKGVLIPRADTETLVETGLQLIKEVKEPSVLDLCAGSGAVGISIAVNRRDSNVLLLEKYETAYLYLKENIALNNADNSEALKGDVLKGDCSDRKFDLIVSNPPYIKSAEIKYLEKEVKCEPLSALDGGSDGLNFYRAIINNYKIALKSGGKICFEVGINQSESVKEMLHLSGFEDVETAKDYSGIDRVVFGTVK